jgi:O-acetyl-ADP-ribose deacetylase (regulator of RNase III)
MATQQATTPLGEGWLEVQQSNGQPPFYVHQASNRTQWERPVVSAPAAGGADPLAGELCAHYGLSEESIRAGVEQCRRHGVSNLAEFERTIDVTHLQQLGFTPADEKTIGAKRKEEAARREKAQAEAAKATAPEVSQKVGEIDLIVKGMDIGSAWTDAVVSPANGHSFTQGDGGVSGVLRGACSNVGRAGNFSDVCYQEKTWLNDAGEEVTGTLVPETQAALQAAGGKLANCGVKFVIHAVGPEWTQFTAEQCATRETEHFKYIETMIRTTVTRSLSIAASKGCVSVIMPSISGGIFTHGGNAHGGAPALPGQQNAEQLAAREAVVAGCRMWAMSESGASSSVREINIVDHPNPRIGRLDLLRAGFQTCFAPDWQPPTPQPEPGVPPPVPTPPPAVPGAAEGEDGGDDAPPPPVPPPPAATAEEGTPPPVPKAMPARTRTKTVSLRPTRLRVGTTAAAAAAVALAAGGGGAADPDAAAADQSQDSLTKTLSTANLSSKVWKKHLKLWPEKFARIVQPPGTTKPGLYLYDSAEANLEDYLRPDSIPGDNLRGSVVEKRLESWAFQGEFPMLWIGSAARADSDGGDEEKKKMQIVFPRNDEEPQEEGEAAAGDTAGFDVCDAFVEACFNLAAGREWNQAEGFAPPVVPEPPAAAAAAAAAAEGGGGAGGGGGGGFVKSPPAEAIKARQAAVDAAEGDGGGAK